MLPLFDDGIYGFKEPYGFLSNFTLITVVFDNIEYPSVEHAYQAAKTYDLEHRETIRFAATPGIAKRLGKQVILRSDWETVKIPIMKNLLIQKFSDPLMKQLLLDTGDKYIEETNTWGDVFWGVCDGKGQNVLGNLLMEIRSSLRD